MNITFLIGNGFDLNLNLNTRYSDFYEYYINNDPKDLLSTSIKNDYEKWSDLEFGLGEFLKNIDETQIGEFLDSKSTLERMLSEYLTKENNRIAIKDENALGEEFREKTLNFFGEFNAVEKDHFHRVISRTTEQINYCFVTFNYTSILDSIISVVQKECKPFTSHPANGTRYQDAIILPHHIHGKLTEDLILGIDNADQIMNDRLKSNLKLSKYIIKSEVNKALGEKKIEKTKSIIDNSKYICLFGLSIGDTDRMWWQYLIEWLRKDNAHRLVLYIKKNTNAHISGQEKVRFIDSIREMMCERGHCEDPDTLNQVMERMIIILNSTIFNLDNVVLLNQNDS